jgi:hypothetical protein
MPVNSGEKPILIRIEGNRTPTKLENRSEQRNGVTLAKR